MYLRWMVRNDTAGVDFGIWKKISPSQLVIPIDVHVARVAKRFNLLQNNKTDWQAALELTAYLRTLDAADPVKYDFALFGTGVMEKYVENTALIQDINSTLAIALPDKISFEELQRQLANHINQLIKNNFESLVALLYKIDVDENKLKLHLIDNPNDDAGNVIALLIIERLQQKAAFKKQFANKPSSADNEEK